MKTTAEQAHAAAAQWGTWAAYGGTARVVLAVALLGAAAGVAYAALRLPLPARPARPTAAARTFRVATWLVSIAVLLVCLAADLKHMQDEHLLHALPADHIAPVTFTAMCVTFFVILVAGSSRGTRAALKSAAIGAIAAPIIFEFPFDLIVMARSYPPIPPDPALWRGLFFAPFLLAQVTTLALLTLSPMVRLSRAALVSFALMLGVFAVWALFGFAYPSAPVPIALNIVSKILAFAAALSLFLPQPAAVSTPGPGQPAVPLMQAPRQHV